MRPAVVLDTNVVVSALLKSDGLEDLVFRLALAGHLKLFVSPDILQEYAAVLPRPKLKLNPAEIERVLKEIHKAATEVHPIRRVKACPDEADNRFLECAETAHGHFLVTGNIRHFPKQWKGTKVVNARQLLAQVNITLFE